MTEFSVVQTYLPDEATSPDTATFTDAYPDRDSAQRYYDLCVAEHEPTWRMRLYDGDNLLAEALGQRTSQTAPEEQP